MRSGLSRLAMRIQISALEAEVENLRRQHANDVQVAARMLAYSGDYLARAMKAEATLEKLRCLAVKRKKTEVSE